MPVIKKPVAIDTSDLYKLLDVIESLHSLRILARSKKMPATESKAIDSIAVLERVERALSAAVQDVTLQEIGGAE